MEPILNYFNLDWHGLIKTKAFILNFKIFFYIYISKSCI